jgi:pyridoxamine 5'-phosphate oxidase
MSGGDPMELFRAWLGEGARGDEPGAAVRAGGANAPAHAVRLAYADHGFVFFAGHAEPLALALAAHPRAEIRIAWPALGREVRAEGTAVRTGDVESDERFGTLPREEQLRAWRSGAQSDAEIADRFAGQEIPRPRRWGGFRIVPDALAFRARGAAGEERMAFRRASPAAPWARELA